MTRFLFFILIHIPLISSGAISGINIAPAGQGGASGCATPNAPSDLQYDGSDNPFHTLTWTSASGSKDGYEVWVSINGGAFAIDVGQIPSGDTTVTPTGAIGDGFVYVFKIRATNACGTQSAFSNTVTNDIFADATHYWTLNETAGNNRTDSIGAISFAETGGQVDSVAGINGNGSDFQPVSKPGHYLSSSASITISLPATIAVWVNFRTLPASMTASTIWLMDEGGANGILHINSIGDLEVQLVDGSDVPMDQNLGALNAWHLIVYTNDGSDNSISVDGATFTTDSSGGAGASGTLKLGPVTTFAGTYGPSPLVPDAIIDEFCIFSHVLSQAEVTSLYGGGTAPRFK